MLLFYFRGVFRIHPSFRIVALAEPPVLSSATGQWLNAEMLSMFLFHSMNPLPIKDEVKVIDSLTHDDITDKIFELSETLRVSKDPTVSDFSSRYKQLHGAVSRLMEEGLADGGAVVFKFIHDIRDESPVFTGNFPVSSQSEFGVKSAIFGFLMFPLAFWLNLAELSSNMNYPDQSGALALIQ